MHLEKATPAHLDHFATWRAADRLERLTCRPVEDGKRVAPSSEAVTWAFLVDGREEPAGVFSCFDTNPRNRSAEFGYSIHPDMRGEGWGRRMLKEALDEVFASTRLNKLYCQTASFNAPSVRLLTALGFYFRWNAARAP